MILRHNLGEHCLLAFAVHGKTELTRYISVREEDGRPFTTSKCLQANLTDTDLL